MFFLADEASMQAAAAASAAAGSSSTSQHHHHHMQQSTTHSLSSSTSSSQNFGVRSLEASISDAELRRLGSNVPAASAAAATTTTTTTTGHMLLHNESEAEMKDDVASLAATEDDDNEDGEPEDEDEGESDALSITDSTANGNLDYMSTIASGMSQPMTPVIAPMTPSELPGTPRSSTGTLMGGSTLLQEALGVGAPQLIMPEITMPIRRPFTEKGKRIGRLKVLIAGDSGIGKSSLIKSIFQVCEDIVHVDPVASNVSASGRHGMGSLRGGRGGDQDTTRAITEVHASTKAYPQWWSEIDDSKVLRGKRRSVYEEQIIERNLCFVDTPGYGSGTSVSGLAAGG